MVDSSKMDAGGLYYGWGSGSSTKVIPDSPLPEFSYSASRKGERLDVTISASASRKVRDFTHQHPLQTHNVSNPVAPGNHPPF